VTHRGLIFGTSVFYSIFHTQGGGNLPKREHVGITENSIDNLAVKVADQTIEELKP
jgi:hypothetical protein